MCYGVGACVRICVQECVTARKCAYACVYVPTHVRNVLIRLCTTIILKRRLCGIKL